MKYLITIIFLFLTSNSLISADERPTTDQQEMYQSIIQEVRCLVCQNQSIAESNADLAKDLRAQILDQVIAGKTKYEIKNYLLDRYGDFVLYQPVFSEKTLFLWISPIILLILIVGWYRKISN
ncbi:MAG: cytochrome c-type biogenesis protein CcmH [Gammaproteobacteria bacterium]|jgi:cytochrome c-type biogenesis protein CcmH|nr:cytochrome c-type biogenesis protein CcmH [Gammaproteobacteria bacterium]MBT5217466.1 cytochrome c-type biogenesis protein CcmH [Gammaproteobacteria bacterium]MBT5541877.1 cytochrome c-type biogenesis protein CcmH [Gammaproteobacteria bacterium]MBT6074322.1 cytochrome c-type biogenesis protein CcmH [Gammaproteobacteria bacterium]MBT7754133.1 cytochrome c-type biogenesis protein CcmH [Gammaproteobacteria bacterium]